MNSHTKLIAEVLLALLSASAVTYVIHGAEGVHVPFLIAALGAVVIGFVDSKRGWRLAILQSALLLAGVFLVTDWLTAEARIRPDLEVYGALGAVAMTFTGSFIGAFIKRALDS